MITEDYVGYEVAKLLKEKGFDECCEAYYEDGRFCWVWNDGRCRNTDNPKYVSCPTQALAMKWLREVHNVHVSVNPIVDYVEDADGHKYEDNVYWAFEFINSVSGRFIELTDNDYQFDTYEDAVEAALKDCLTNKI